LIRLRYIVERPWNKNRILIVTVVFVSSWPTKGIRNNEKKMDAHEISTYRFLHHLDRPQEEEEEEEEFIYHK